MGNAIRTGTEELMRSLGGGPITLRISTGLSAADARGLGMTAPSLENVEVASAMFLVHSDGTRAVQLAASAVRRVAESRGTNADDMLACVAAVVTDGKSVPVAKVEPQYIGLVEHMYTLVLTE